MIEICTRLCLSWMFYQGISFWALRRLVHYTSSRYHWLLFEFHHCRGFFYWAEYHLFLILTSHLYITNLRITHHWTECSDPVIVLYDFHTRYSISMDLIRSMMLPLVLWFFSHITLLIVLCHRGLWFMLRPSLININVERMVRACIW